MSFFGGFSSSKLKPQLKMAVNRIQIASNKKSALLKQNMREIGKMLSEDPPKEEKAKIRAEAIIRDDNLIEAYEILQLQCELLHERIKLIEYSKQCPPDLVPVISTLIWAAHRVDVPELMMIRKQFRAKYGKQFEEDALQNANGVLNERVVSKLSVHPPAAYLVQTYLERICEQFEVNWTPKVKLSTNEMIEPMAAPVGYSVQVAQGTGLGPSAVEVPTAITGLEQGEGDNNNNNNNQNGFGIPPPAPGSRGGGGGGDGGGGTPVAVAQPYIPPPVNTKGPDDLYEEVDIFVPGAPSAPPGSNVVTSPSSTTIGGNNGQQQQPTPPPPINSKENDYNDDQDDQGSIPPPAPGGSTGGDGGDNGGSSYADLAARFDKLGK